MTTEITIQTILDLLPIVAEKRWRNRYGRLRYSGLREEICPVCALVNEILDEECFSWTGDAAMKVLLGRRLSDEELKATGNIMHAADDPISIYRGDLCQALGISDDSRKN